MTNAGWRVGRHHTAVCDKVDDQHKEEVPGCCGFVWFILFCFCQVYWRPLEVTYIPFIFLGLQPIFSDHHPTLCSSIFSLTIYTFVSLHSPTISPLLRSPIKIKARPLPPSSLLLPFQSCSTWEFKARLQSDFCHQWIIQMVEEEAERKRTGVNDFWWWQQRRRS